ncbi:SprT-like family-domain-containing protein [Pelagophyceae sp. CCMP2097]|nr:SprT-like family-domain-containing protein [Pelagophyceae sp. CCMP2097]
MRWPTGGATPVAPRPAGGATPLAPRPAGGATPARRPAGGAASTARRPAGAGRGASSAIETPYASDASSASTASPAREVIDLLSSDDDSAARDVIEISSGSEEGLWQRDVVDLASESDDDVVSSHNGGVSRAAAGRKPAKKSAAVLEREREEQLSKIFKDLNEAVFRGEARIIGALGGVSCSWSKRLRTTAGLTRLFSRGEARLAKIELSTHVLDTPLKLESTLAHELCHAAAWLLDGVARPPHGAVFMAWGLRVTEKMPHLAVATTHRYAIFYKFVHRCEDESCLFVIGRHSNSVDIATDCCARCGSRLKRADSAALEQTAKKTSKLRRGRGRPRKTDSPPARPKAPTRPNSPQAARTKAPTL